jgi:FkbM family methyltransferase
VQTRINGYELLVIANEDVGRVIHYLGRFEPAETELFGRVIGAEDVCLDVGANVGYFSLLMAQRASRGSVHSFEPQPLTANLLRASLELNGSSNVFVNQCAVGDREGTVSFSKSKDSAYSSMHDTKRRPVEEQLTVPMVTLDDYLEKRGVGRVSVIKVDVEGAEDMVVKGAARLLAAPERRPRLVMLELYDPNLEVFGKNISDVVEAMRGFGYAPHVIGDDSGLIPYAPAHRGIFHNIFFTHGEMPIQQR